MSLPTERSALVAFNVIAPDGRSYFVGNTEVKVKGPLNIESIRRIEADLTERRVGGSRGVVVVVGLIWEG